VELNHREEILWRQRSRITWLTARDRNTCFFHLRASRRRRRNRITKLKRADGGFTQDEQELKELASSFYGNLFRFEGVHNMDVVLHSVPVKVSSEMNDKILRPFTDAEVKEALSQMFPTKAPGSDGYPAHFFQCHWELCGTQVTSAVLQKLEGRMILV
jgi:hypothetical protein